MYKIYKRKPLPSSFRRTPVISLSAGPEEGQRSLHFPFLYSMTQREFPPYLAFFESGQILLYSVVDRSAVPEALPQFHSRKADFITALQYLLFFFGIKGSRLLAFGRGNA